MLGLPGPISEADPAPVRRTRGSQVAAAGRDSWRIPSRRGRRPAVWRGRARPVCGAFPGRSLVVVSPRCRVAQGSERGEGEGPFELLVSASGWLLAADRAAGTAGRGASPAQAARPAVGKGLPSPTSNPRSEPTSGLDLVPESLPGRGRARAALRRRRRVIRPPPTVGRPCRTSQGRGRSGRCAVFRPSDHAAGRDADGRRNCTRTGATTAAICADGSAVVECAIASPARAPSPRIRRSPRRPVREPAPTPWRRISTTW